MVTEEIGLNGHLESAGVTAVETDLGEWLLQVAGDHPSPLVMPAIHKRAAQIAFPLEATLGRPFDPADIDAMVKVVRSELLEQFLGAGMGISGAHALIAESGTVMLIRNEENNRMSVALPPVHVVVAGIEKLVPDMDSAMDQVRLLARSRPVSRSPPTPARTSPPFISLSSWPGGSRSERRVSHPTVRASIQSR